MLDGRGLFVAQMTEQNITQLRSGSPPKRIQNGFVFAHGFAPAFALASKVGGIADATNPAGKVGVGCLQRGVAGSLNNFLMDELVDAKIAMHIAIEVETVHFIV